MKFIIFLSLLTFTFSCSTTQKTHREVAGGGYGHQKSIEAIARELNSKELSIRLKAMLDRIDFERLRSLNMLKKEIANNNRFNKADFKNAKEIFDYYQIKNYCNPDEYPNGYIHKEHYSEMYRKIMNSL